MYITKQSDYAVLLMQRLAEQYDDKKTQPFSLMQLAKDYEMSFFFLQRIARSLRKANLVKGVEGRQGGYMLTKSPDKITLGDIVRVIEGPVSIMDCAVEGKEKDPVPCPCKRNEVCLAKFAWRDLQKLVSNYLDNLTLTDLLKRSQTKTPKR